jgi:nucleotide-binding universal stress UspA family protein
MDPSSQGIPSQGALIPIEGGPFDTEALEFAADVIAALGLQPVVLHIFASEQAPGALEQLTHQATSMLADLSPEILFEIGDYETEVCRYLEQQDFGLLVLGAAAAAAGGPPSPADQRLANSVASNVLLLQAPVEAIEQVLVCTTGKPVSLTLVNQGLLLAKAKGAQVTLLHVASKPPTMYTGLPSLPESLPLLLSHDTPLAQHLKELAAMAETMGVEAEIQLRHGIVAEEIIRECEMRHHDIVVLGAAVPGRAINRLLMEEIAPHVVANIPRPILIVRHATEHEDDAA